ncbi:MAG TPA: SRPBCC family protein, partial [Gammaproteobacteria bacterium]
MRALDASPSVAGALIDTLASANDRLWPREAWPAVTFDRPLRVGATGGHGPVGYIVSAYDPGEFITFRFTAPAGFEGIHRFEIIRKDAGCELRHTLEMVASWPAVITWPLFFRRLHDALIEDALARAQMMLGETPAVIPWTPYVRFLRWLSARGRAPAQTVLFSQDNA